MKPFLGSWLLREQQRQSSQRQISQCPCQHIDSLLNANQHSDVESVMETAIAAKVYGAKSAFDSRV